jgi:hypothetical protein
MSDETVQPRRWVPRSYAVRYGAAVRIELAIERRMRTRNTTRYRIAHWPIWVWVFFIAPGPFTAALFAGAAGRGALVWLGVVLAGTAAAAVLGRLPGTEPAPYILRFGDDLPNPVYRRVCYTFAWSVMLTFAALNLLGLADAVVTGHWRMREIYAALYLPLAGFIWVLGALGKLPRARASTKHEGIDRRYFYGTNWVVITSQAVLLVLWKTLPSTRDADLTKLAAYVACLATVGLLARYGLLPRTRPILPGVIGRAD